MAIIKVGALITGIRGGVAGNVFSQNKSGPYVRGWYRGANRRSELQGGQRGRLGGMSARWRSLSAGEKAGWDVYAALPAQEKTNSLGESYFGSGVNWFVEVNTARAQIGQDTLETAPAAGTPAVPVLESLTLEIDGTDVTADVEWPAATFGEDESVVLFAVLVPRGGHQVASSGFYQMVVSQNPPDEGYSFGDEVKGRWGVPAVGDQLFVRAAIQSVEGRRGAVGSINAVFSEV